MPCDPLFRGKCLQDIGFQCLDHIQFNISTFAKKVTFRNISFLISFELQEKLCSLFYEHFFNFWLTWIEETKYKNTWVYDALVTITIQIWEIQTPQNTVRSIVVTIAMFFSRLYNVSEPPGATRVA